MSVNVRIQLIGPCCWTLGELIVTLRFHMKARRRGPGFDLFGEFGF